MEELNRFVSEFADEKIGGAIKLKNSFFLAEKELIRAKGRIRKEPFSAGLFLGETKNGRFVPGASLLDILSKKTKRKVFVGKKTEWLFLCGRDVFGRGIVKANAKEGLVLVQNERDENLGYGKITGDLSKKDKVVIKNLFDRGSFLRREKNKAKEVSKWKKER